MNRRLPNLFTFLEYSVVDPMNNASELVLRYIVVFRMIRWQNKGAIKP